MTFSYHRTHKENNFRTLLSNDQAKPGGVGDVRVGHERRLSCYVQSEDEDSSPSLKYGVKLLFALLLVASGQHFNRSNNGLTHKVTWCESQSLLYSAPPTYSLVPL